MYVITAAKQTQTTRNMVTSFNFINPWRSVTRYSFMLTRKAIIQKADKKLIIINPWFINNIIFGPYKLPFLISFV
jgi:hypothetical protein